MSKSASGFDVRLPRSLKAERRGDIAVLFLARAEKRNAIDDPTVFGIEAFFAALPDAIKAVVLAGEGDPDKVVEAQGLAVVSDDAHLKVVGYLTESYARRRYAEELDQATQGIV